MKATSQCARDPTIEYVTAPAGLSDEALLRRLLRFDEAVVALLELGSLQDIAWRSTDELCQIPHMNKSRAEQFLAAIELGRRVQEVQEGEDSPAIRSSRDAFEILRREFKEPDKEVILSLLMNVRNQLIEVDTVAMGGLSQCAVTPGDIFRKALRTNASSIILGHNHPSGNPEPSNDDRLLTLRVHEASRVLGVKLLDHVIVGAGSYYSFSDRGLL